jgi:hypothetical protein
MKLVEKIKGLFRKQPLTDERIAALAEAESTRQQVLQQAAEIRSSPGRGKLPRKQREGTLAWASVPE